MLRKIRIEHRVLDQKSGTLAFSYYNRIEGGTVTLFQDGTVQNRLPLPKEKSDEHLRIWSQSVLDHESTDIERKARSTSNEADTKYYSKKLVFHFFYEDDPKELERIKVANENKYKEHKRWAAFHAFHSKNPDINVIDATGKPTNLNRTGDYMWIMTDQSAISAGDATRKKMGMKMSGILTDAYDSNRTLFLQMCHGMGLSNEIKLYGSDHTKLWNDATDALMRNPSLLEHVLNNPDKDYVLAIRKAVGEGVITQSSGAFWLAEELIGRTEEEAVQYFKLNAGKFAAISDKKLEPATPTVTDPVPAEDVIELKIKAPSQRFPYVRARRNEFANTLHLEVFEQRLSNVLTKNDWQLSETA